MSSDRSRSNRVAVLGAGNTGLALAARLALQGHEVVLWDTPSFGAALEPFQQTRQVRLTGDGGEGVAQLATVTTDAAEALGQANVLIAAVPSYAHQPFVEELAPHLEERHLLALLPGNLGTLQFAHLLRQHAPGRPLPLLLEGDTAPYVCRKFGPDHANIFGVIESIGVGVLPAERTAEAVEMLEEFLPGLRALPHALAAGLGALNPVVHPPGVLMNAGRIERSRGDFYFYEEGVTPSVARMIEALDAERQAIAVAFGFELSPVAEGFSTCGFGPVGDLWATINGSRMLTQMQAPGSIETRWLSEDVPFGVRTWVALADRVGVPAPIARSMVDLGAVLIGADPWTTGRSLADLGIDDLSLDELQTYLQSGVYPESARPRPAEENA